MIYVSDSQGRITGADINSPFNQYGEQDISLLLQNIPHSGAVQTNIADNDTGLPSPGTPWEVNIMDGGAQSYAIHLVGIANDVEQVQVELLYHSRTMTALKQTIFVPTEIGVTKTVNLNCDPTNRSLQLALVVAPGDFLRDTQSACSLKDIAPEDACDKLEKLASSVEKALTKGDADDERKDLKNYLRDLNRIHSRDKKGERSDRHGEEGDRAFAKDPAYSALKLDAETLLKALPQDKEHGHDGGDKDKTDKDHGHGRGDTDHGDHH